MASLPSAIIYLNDPGGFYEQSQLATRDTPNPSTIDNLIHQLFITDIMSKCEFDKRVVADPNYPTIVHLMNYRILVILKDMRDLCNRQYADIVALWDYGMLYVEFNRFNQYGPPGQSYDGQRLNIYELLRASHSQNDICIPMEAMPGYNCDICSYPFWCDLKHDYAGRPICDHCGCKAQCGCTVHLPNCDREFNNITFLNRK